MGILATLPQNYPPRNKSLLRVSLVSLNKALFTPYSWGVARIPLMFGDDLFRQQSTLNKKQLFELYH